MQRSSASDKKSTSTNPERNQPPASSASTEQASSSSTNPVTTTAASFMIQNRPLNVTNSLDTLATVASNALMQLQNPLFTATTNNLDMLATAALGMEEQQNQVNPLQSSIRTRSNVIQHTRMHPYQQNLESRPQAGQCQPPPAQLPSVNSSLLEALLTPRVQSAQSLSLVPASSLISLPAPAQASTSAKNAPENPYQAYADTALTLAAEMRFDYKIISKETPEPKTKEDLKKLVIDRATAGITILSLFNELKLRFPNMECQYSVQTLGIWARERKK